MGPHEMAQTWVSGVELRDFEGFGRERYSLGKLLREYSDAGRRSERVKRPRHGYVSVAWMEARVALGRWSDPERRGRRGSRPGRCRNVVSQVHRAWNGIQSPNHQPDAQPVPSQQKVETLINGLR